MRLRLSFRGLSAGILTTLLFMLAGCGDDPAPSTDKVAEVPPASTNASLSGRVYASNVSGSTVNAFLVDGTGKATGAALATTTTDANGNYLLPINAAAGSAILIVANGGTYTSEADGSTQTLGQFSSLLTSLATGSNTVQVNPLTTAIAAAASNLLSSGTGNLATAFSTSEAAMKKLFGVDQLTASSLLALPDPGASSGDGWLLAALVGTLEQLRANSGINGAALYQALQTDAADGKLDGLNNGKAVSLGSASNLQVSLFTSEWSSAAKSYGASNPVYSAATTTISGALQVSVGDSGLVGSSGSIAPLVTQASGSSIYFAARSQGLVKLDMTDPAAPVASRVTSINNALMTSLNVAAGIFTSLDGIVINPTPVNNKFYAVLYSYATSTIASVNLTDGVVVGTKALQITNTASFSGASAKVAGGIADGKRGLVWLATGDGLLGIDPTNLTTTPILIAQPAGYRINENIGGDPASDIIYSPEYFNGGLVVYNLAEQRAYVIDISTWRNSIATGWSVFEVDGAALDSVYKVAILAPEGGNIGLATYATPSGATTPVGTISTAPRFMQFSGGGTNFAGSAIDPTTHTALFVGEGFSLGVGVLDNPANPTWAGFTSFVRTGVSSYRFEPHDPHTVGAFNVLGKPYGFVLQGSSTYKVGVIDLQAMLSAPAVGGVLSADPMINPAIVKQLTF